MSVTSKHNHFNRAVMPPGECPGCDNPPPPAVTNELAQWLSRIVRSGLNDIGVSQAALARELGVSEKHISLVLNGRAAAKVETWDKMLRLVGNGPEGWDD